jgi:hypothetical protein
MLRHRVMKVTLHEANTSHLSPLFSDMGHALRHSIFEHLTFVLVPFLQNLKQKQGDTAKY